MTGFPCANLCRLLARIGARGLPLSGISQMEAAMYAPGEVVLVMGQTTARGGVRVAPGVELPLRSVHVVADVPASTDVGEEPVGLLLMFPDDAARAAFQSKAAADIPARMLG